MQTAIVEKLGLDPVDKEVVVLYDGEKDKVRLIQFVVSNGMPASYDCLCYLIYSQTNFGKGNELSKLKSNDQVGLIRIYFKKLHNPRPPLRTSNQLIWDKQTLIES